MVDLLAIAAFMLQVPRPFKATAKLDVPYMVGEDSTIHGSGEKIDVGLLRILTVRSARLATTYPNLSENVSAGAGEKLFVVRGSIKNPSAVVDPIGPSSFLRIRFWDGKGKGDFKYVGIYDPQTHATVHGNLRKGESAEFECVVRIPADFTSFHVGFYHRSPGKTAWYDFNPVMGKIASIFSRDGLSLVDQGKSPSGQAFDFDLYRMKVLGTSEPEMIGGMAKGGQPICVVSVEVANTMLLPARWGWQYVSAELVMKDGSVVPSVRDLIDKATDKTWSGDLGVDASMVSQFVFRPPAGGVPVALRMTLTSNKRTVEIPL